MVSGSARVVPLLLCMAVAFAAAGAADDTPLPKFTLALYKSVYTEGEPIGVSLSVANDTPEPIEGGFMDNRQFESLGKAEFRVYGTDGVEVAFVRRPTWMAAGSMVRFVQPILGSGACLECDQMIFPSAWRADDRERGPVTELLKPGLYKLDARLDWPISGSAMKLASNTVDFEIREATGGNIGALKLLQDTLLQYFMMTYATPCPESGDQLLTEHPDSIYARYIQAHKLIGKLRACERPSSSTSLPEPIRQQFEEAVVEAIGFVDAYPDLPLCDNILLLVGEKEDGMGRESDTMVTYERLIAEYPDGDARPLAEKALGKLQEAYQRYLERQAKENQAPTP